MLVPEPWLPIHTLRLVLRDVRESDLGDLHEYASDEQTVRFMPGDRTRASRRAMASA